MSRDHSPFDAITLENDRREIHEKMRRHIQAGQQHEDGGDVNTFNRDGSHQAYHDDQSNDLALNTEGYDSLHQAISDERSKMNGGFSESGQGHSDTGGYLRRGPNDASSASDGISRGPPPRVNFDSRITQSMDRRVLSIMYLILVLVLLISYGFFLVSNKLLHYASNKR